MTKKEFSVIASSLRTYYPRENLLPNLQAMELWYDQLQDLPYVVAEAILKKWVATNRWSPSIADFRAEAGQMKMGTTKNDWGDGWEQVMRAIHMYGYYQPDAAMESLDPVTRQCVKRIGFQNICLSEDITADRANFRMLYEQISERERKEAQIPDNIKTVIENARSLFVDAYISPTAELGVLHNDDTCEGLS